MQLNASIISLSLSIHTSLSLYIYIYMCIYIYIYIHKYIPCSGCCRTSPPARPP